jgi:hypothetical protein
MAKDPASLIDTNPSQAPGFYLAPDMHLLVGSMSKVAFSRYF